MCRNSVGNSEIFFCSDKNSYLKTGVPKNTLILHVLKEMDISFPTLFGGVDMKYFTRMV